MTQAVQKLIPQLAQLSLEERAKLACYLLQSLHGEEPAVSEDDFYAELERRRAAHESGLEPGEPAEKVLRELREEP